MMSEKPFDPHCSEFRINHSKKEVSIVAGMLFIISNGFEKAGRAARAFHLAKVACEKANEVKVFLMEEAILWARLGYAEGARTSTGE